MVPSNSSNIIKEIMRLPTILSKMANSFEKEQLGIIFQGWTVRLFVLLIFFIKSVESITSLVMLEGIKLLLV